MNSSRPAAPPKPRSEAGLKVTDISVHTGFPEMMDGRGNRVPPKIRTADSLYIRGNKEHEEAAKQHFIEPIDLVVVNLYPFEKTVAKPDVLIACFF